MKISKYKEVFTKIDTDPVMDHRIQNKLLYHEYEGIGYAQREERRAYGKKRGGSVIRILSRLQPALPSVAFLAVIAVIILGIGAKLKTDEKTPASENMISIDQGEESNGKASTDIGELTHEVAEDAEVNSDDGRTEDISFNSEDGQTHTVEQPDDLKEVSDIKHTADTEALDTMVKDNPEDTHISDINKDKLATDEAGKFYMAHFDVISEGGYKRSIPSLMIRLHGTVDTISPEDLTDLVLTRDGIPVDNIISKEYTVNQFTWGYEEVTDFIFQFNIENREPGNYGMIGKYKGEAFRVYNKIIEGTMTDEPADPNALKGVNWVYSPDKDGRPQKVAEVVFSFSGTQYMFNPEDVTDIKFTRDGVEITDYSFMEQVFRYLETFGDSADTSFNLVFNNAFDQSGTYVITGKYRGVEFTSWDITIP